MSEDDRAVLNTQVAHGLAEALSEVRDIDLKSSVSSVVTQRDREIFRKLVIDATTNLSSGMSRAAPTACDIMSAVRKYTDFDVIHSDDEEEEGSLRIGNDTGLGSPDRHRRPF